MDMLKKIVVEARKLCLSGAFNSDDTTTILVDGYTVEFLGIVADNGVQCVQASVEIVENSWVSFEISLS